MKYTKIGEKSNSSYGQKMEIIEYRGWNDIDIMFEDGTIVHNKEYSKFKIGNIKNPNLPIVYGIGYFGIGKYVAVKNKKITKEYNMWHDMLRRCYDKKWNLLHQTYSGASVSKEWLNFQNFAEWYFKNIYYIDDEEMQLDKDILYKNNKIYSDSTCIIVPKKINVLFVKNTNKKDDLPCGCYKYGNKIISIFNGKSLGIYNNKEDAFNIYKKEKELYIKKIADSYKEKIPIHIYNAIINYKIEIDD